MNKHLEDNRNAALESLVYPAVGRLQYWTDPDSDITPHERIVLTTASSASTSNIILERLKARNWRYGIVSILNGMTSVVNFINVY
jgi:hypothetical protein